MALLIANAQAMVIRISHEIYFVYLRAGKRLVHAIITIVTEAKKNISNFKEGKCSLKKGNSPIVAPMIIINSKTKANNLFFFPACGSTSSPFAIIKNTEESPHVFTNDSSAISTKVSPSVSPSHIVSLPNPLEITLPFRLISRTSAP